MELKKGTVSIHGKVYKTVALRVNEFRESHGQEYGIETDLITNADLVIIKAVIKDKGGFVVSTGYAEEVRGSTMINKTSALENCETSAIGRALAGFGFAGEEYASANEVQNAIHQQKNPIKNGNFRAGANPEFLPKGLKEIYGEIRYAVDNEDWPVVAELFDTFDVIEEKKKVGECFSSSERSAMAKYRKSPEFKEPNSTRVAYIK